MYLVHAPHASSFTWGNPDALYETVRVACFSAGVRGLANALSVSPSLRETTRREKTALPLLVGGLLTQHGLNAPLTLTELSTLHPPLIWIPI